MFFFHMHLTRSYFECAIHTAVITALLFPVSLCIHPLLMLAHYLMPLSQSAVLVSRAHYFSGVFTLLGAACQPVYLLLFSWLCLL